MIIYYFPFILLYAIAKTGPLYRLLKYNHVNFDDLIEWLVKDIPPMWVIHLTCLPIWAFVSYALIF